jgi:hypothetical protein
VETAGQLTRDQNDIPSSKRSKGGEMYLALTASTRTVSDRQKTSETARTRAATRGSSRTGTQRGDWNLEASVDQQRDGRTFLS